MTTAADRRPPAVIVVGGGISGLAAAFELARRGVPMRLLESGPRWGGLVRTERTGRLTLDPGADGFTITKPGALELCRDLGIDSRLIAPQPPPGAFVLRGGRLYPLPRGGVFGLPSVPWRLLRARLFTWSGRVRMAVEPWVAPGDPGEDESIASFMTRRFGREAAEYLADPLLAGIHAGDVDRLSVRALFPALVDAERTHGSVLRGLARIPRDETTGPFRSFPGGIAELIDSLVRALPAEAIWTRTPVRRIAQDGGEFAVETGSGLTLRAPAVVLALPAYATATVLQACAPSVAALCAEIRYASTVAVMLSYDRTAVGRPLAGSGFVVPGVERHTRILAATFVSTKWPGRAPEDQALFRVFLGGARDAAIADLDDHRLAAIAHADLARVLRIRSSPRFARVYRWTRASPQLELGHHARLAALDRALAALPGLFLTGAGLRAVGLPDCITDARRTAAAAAEFVTARLPRAAR
ncbi:MAG TPA: protoporphyrinogen oxidase [Vicinamibacterales bacterium]|nr:protoporphyrinogen oxidase [Vicinamibacterales bacterium]